MSSFYSAPAASLFLILYMLRLAACSPISEAHPVSIVSRTLGKPVLGMDFPDPAILQDIFGDWYAFATNGNGKNVQVAWFTGHQGEWELLDLDLLPEFPAWAAKKNIWAPDVWQMDDGSYVLYFTGETPQNAKRHCVGAAVSMLPLGPYIPEDKPFACHLDDGGAIDPAGFRDVDGKRYVMYKVDGNSAGHGGFCDNTNPPIHGTPIMLQEVAADGITKVGEEVKILDRIDSDGPLVEAPSMFRTKDGLYVLWFSTGCYTEDYKQNYAVSHEIQGPYKRMSNNPILKTDPKYNLTSPGGASVAQDGSGILFHANCGEHKRCLHSSGFNFGENGHIFLTGKNDMGGTF